MRDLQAYRTGSDRVSSGERSPAFLRLSNVNGHRYGSRGV
jgi:orotate phosphoribosyltransferase